MVKTTVSGFAADVEKKWFAQMAPEATAKEIKEEITGAFGLSRHAEQEWLSLLGTRA